MRTSDRGEGGGLYSIHVGRGGGGYQEEGLVARTKSVTQGDDYQVSFGRAGHDRTLSVGL